MSVEVPLVIHATSQFVRMLSNAIEHRRPVFPNGGWAVAKIRTCRNLSRRSGQTPLVYVQKKSSVWCFAFGLPCLSNHVRFHVLAVLCIHTPSYAYRAVFFLVRAIFESSIQIPRVPWTLFKFGVVRRECRRKDSVKSPPTPRDVSKAQELKQTQRAESIWIHSSSIYYDLWQG